MSQEFDIKRLNRQRRDKKVRKLFKKVIAISVLLCIAAVVYLCKDNWLPLFDGIATKCIPTFSNSGKLAEGEFPIKIQGGSDYQASTLENNIVIADDTHLYIYNSDGKAIQEKQHEYANPKIRTNRNKILIYDMGGKKFALESKYKTIYSKEIEDKILLARISSTDYTAIVTISDKYSSMMSIYDPSGNMIYSWKSTTGRIIDVNFTSTNNGCYVTTFDSKDGQIISKINKFEFNNDKKIWETESIDTMPIKTFILNDGTMQTVGDTKCTYFSKTGDFLSEYQYTDDLVGFCVSDTKSAFLLKNEQLRKYQLVIKNSVTDINTVSIGTELKSVKIYKDKIYVLTNAQILVYSQNGSLLSSVDVSYEYHDFYKADSYIFLLGNESIDRITCVDK